MDEASRAALTAAGQRYFDMAAKGDVASLRQNAIPSLASDFSGIESTVKDHQPDLAGAQATVKSVFLLDGTTPVAHAEFYCGVFGKNGQTASSAVFYLDNLPPGKYGVALLDATSAKGRTDGFFDSSAGGHRLEARRSLHEERPRSPDMIATGSWRAPVSTKQRARCTMRGSFIAEARSLISPLPFMSTLATDKLYDESQSAQPADVPANGKTVDLAAGTATYKLTAMFPEVVGTDLDLIVKYQAANVSDTTAGLSEQRRGDQSAGREVS